MTEISKNTYIPKYSGKPLKNRRCVEDFHEISRDVLMVPQNEHNRWKK